jgi:hypothetical protein
MTRGESTGLVMAAGLTAAIACSGPATEEITRVQGAVLTSQTFVLPVPVGLNPEGLVLGASNALSINDRARVIANVAGGNTDGDVASMGLTGFTNVGVTARVRNIFSVGGVTLRGSRVTGYVKTSGNLTTQQGTTFGDPAENRTFLNIRQDPIWTVPISTNDTGTTINVPPDVVWPPIGPGTYGNVTVNRGGRLTLSTPGEYLFASLKLEPGSIVVLPQGAGLTQIRVHSELILRSPLTGNFRTILAFRGNNAAIESPFTGGLFLAPNASIEIKAHSTGRFFARNITVFEDVRVTEPSTGITRDVFMPFESIFQGDTLAPGEDQAEISGTVLSTISTACAAPVALTSFHGASLAKTTNPFGGPTSITRAFESLASPQPPPACAGLLPGFLPDEPQRPYGVLPGFGTPVYSPPFTDNITTRLGNGRALMVGLDIRYCIDPDQGPNCPTAPPTAGTPCNQSTLPATCYYGTADYCRCVGNSWTCGAHNCPATKPTLPSLCGAQPVPCYYPNDEYCFCQPGQAGPPPILPTWACDSQKRREGRSLAMHVTNDCGGNWSSHAALDPREMGISNAPATAVVISRSLDRQEVYFDSIENKVYVAFQTSPEYQNFGHPAARAVVLSASTLGTTAQDLLQGFAASWAAGAVRSDPLSDSGFQAMTTVRDERPLRPGGNQSPWSHFVRLRCSSGTEAPAGASPLLDYQSPFGRHNFDLSFGEPLFRCRRVPHGAPDLEIVGGASVALVALPGAPPRVRAAYTSVIDGHQILIVWLITLRSENAYNSPTIHLEEAINPGPGVHALFPQFITSDGLGGSDIRVDTPVVLRWLEASGDTITEKAQVFYPSLSSIGLRGSQRTVAQWSVADAFPGRTCPSSGNTVCFAGDYRYGSFMGKVGTSLGYFIPWTGVNTPAPDTIFANRIRAFGAQLTIQP